MFDTVDVVDDVDACSIPNFEYKFYRNVKNQIIVITTSNKNKGKNGRHLKPNNRQICISTKHTQSNQQV